MKYPISVNYDQDKLTADFVFPLCEMRYEFQAPDRVEPTPPPCVVVLQHLYNKDAQKRCSQFDELRYVPECRVKGTTAELELRPISRGADHEG